MEAPIKRSPKQQSSSIPFAEAETTTTVSEVAQKSAILEKFATLLGTAHSQRTKELAALFSTTVKDDHVVLMVPSLDLQLSAEGDEQPGLNIILPQMGTHNPIVSSSSSSVSVSPLRKMTINEEDEMPSEKMQPPQRPNMAASVLNIATTTSSLSSSSSLLLPLNGEKQLQQQHHHHPLLNTESVDSSIQTAVQNIGKQTSWTKSALPYVTNAVGTNITDSFTTLFNSRLRAWTLILLRHSLSTGSNDSRTKLLCMLNVKIRIQSHEFCYRTLPLPEAAKNAKPIDSDIILPLLFEVSLNVNIQEKIEKVVLRAPGTISAILDESNSLLSLRKVNVQLDTGVFLKSMVDQARMVVLKAVSSATETNIPSSSPASMKEVKNTTDPASLIRGRNPMTASSDLDEKLFSEVPKRPTTTELERMQKARKSALRLNNVLHGKQLKSSVSSITLGSNGCGGSTSGMQNDSNMRKVTSIRWDSTIQNPKFKTALTLTPNISVNPGKDRKKNKLESFKSFGRPHGGDFGSGPRNATFGEYGRPAFAGAWGRDGRLAAHPMPRKNSAVDSMGNLVGGSADLNATFENVVSGNNLSMPNSGKKRGFDSTQYLIQGMNAATSESYRSSAASAGAALLGRLSNQPASSPSSGSESSASLQHLSRTCMSESSLVRTATALESSLLKKWS